MAAEGVSRRAFLGRGAAAAVGATALVIGGEHAATAQTAPKTEPTFGLTPNGGTCNACRQHAANKVFPTADAAASHRAHKGCRCSVVDGPMLSKAVYAALFEDGAKSVDRRNPRSAELLDHGTINGVEVPVFTYALPVVVAGAAGGLWWWMRRHDRKTAPADTVDHGEWR